MSENEEELKMLTVRTLLRDLRDYDMDAEVAVLIEGVPVSLPIRAITKAEAAIDDQLKKYVLMILSPYTVQTAMEFVQKSEAQLHAHEFSEAMTSVH